MREQVVTPRISGRGAPKGSGRSGEIVQRPARRERGGSSSRGGAGTLRKVLAYAPFVAKITLAIVAGVLVFAGYRAAASASFFQARSLDVSGASRASSDEIKAVVRRAVARTGVWQAELPAISRELEGVPWVRRAVVSRVLPDGLRVRVTERVPRAVVRTEAGRLIWVDEDGVNLGMLSPSDQMPAFFIRGWDETGTDAAQAENRERVEKYLEMSREWEAAGLVERVSEVNLGDLRDVRVQLAGDDSQIEVRLGKEKVGDGLRRALKALDEQRLTPCGPFITYLVVQPQNIIVGHTPGTTPPCHGAYNRAGEEESEKTNKDRTPPDARSGSRSRESKEQAARKESERKRKKERTKRDATVDDDSKTQTRPRRVGE